MLRVDTSDSFLGHNPGAGRLLFLKGILKERGKMNVINSLANIFSGLSLVSGFAAIIFSLERHFTYAAWAIIISIIFDGLDGQIARIKPPVSDFGKELDSLVDVVSFGIAPSVLGYIFVYKNFYLLATLALFIYLLCSILRLAKYNITAKDRLANYFYGLPTTVSGGVLASFILINRKYAQPPSRAVFLLIALFLAFLMLSKIRYPNLDGLKQVFAKKLLPFCVIFFAVFIFIPEIAVFAIFLIYLLFSPFMVKRIT